MLTVHLFRGLRVSHDGQAIERFETQKAASLLAYLALFSDRDHAREGLSSFFWPEADPESARSNLRSALAALRRAVTSVGADPDSLLTATRTMVRLRGDVETDAGQFDRLLRRTEHAPAEERASFLSRAVDLYRGDLLPGFGDAWVVIERRRLAQAYRGALHRLIALQQEAGDLEQATANAQRLVEADTHDPAAHETLMELCLQAGRNADVTRQFREMDRILRETNGGLPSTRARELVRQAACAAAPPMRVSRVPPSPSPDRNETARDIPFCEDETPSRADRAAVPGISRPRRARPLTLLAGAGLLVTLAAVIALSRLSLPPLPNRFYVVVPVAEPGSVARSINKKGFVVGSISDRGLDRPFLWRDGKTELRNPLHLGANSTATFIDDAQQIVGWSDQHKSGLRATSWERPDPTIIAKEIGLVPASVNGSGVAVGTHETEVGNKAFALWKGRVLLLPGGGPSSANYISDDHCIVGATTDDDGKTSATGWRLHGHSPFTVADWSVYDNLPEGRYSKMFRRGSGGVCVGVAKNVQGAPRPCRWNDDRKIAELPMLHGMENGEARSINRRKEIVGWGERNTGGSRALIWEDETTVRDLNDLIPPESGWVLQKAVDINEDGWIIGQGALNGKEQGFLLVPVQGSPIALSTAHQQSTHDKRVVAAVVLPGPAATDVVVKLTGPREYADPISKSTTIPAGQRVAVFFLTHNPVQENTTVRITAHYASTKVSAAYTLVP